MKPPTSPSLFLFVCFLFAQLFVVSLFRIGSDPASSEFWKEKEQKYVRGAQPYFLGGFFFWYEITLLVGVVTSFKTGRSRFASCDPLFFGFVLVFFVIFFTDLYQDILNHH